MGGTGWGGCEFQGEALTVRPFIIFFFDKFWVVLPKKCWGFCLVLKAFEGG